MKDLDTPNPLKGPPDDNSHMGQSNLIDIEDLRLQAATRNREVATDQAIQREDKFQEDLMIGFRSVICNYFRKQIDVYQDLCSKQGPGAAEGAVCNALVDLRDCLTDVTDELVISIHSMLLGQRGIQLKSLKSLVHFYCDQSTSR